MDAGNLAIVFGPTLLPTPETLDQVACQAHVNEVIKTVILHHDNIFPDTKELPGPVYEKCMTGDQYWWASGRYPLLRSVEIKFIYVINNKSKLLDVLNIERHWFEIVTHV